MCYHDTLHNDVKLLPRAHLGRPRDNDIYYGHQYLEYINETQQSPILGFAALSEIHLATTTFYGVFPI